MRRRPRSTPGSSTAGTRSLGSSRRTVTFASSATRERRAMSVRSLRAIVVVAILASAIVADLHAQLRTRVHAQGLSLPVAFVQDPDDRGVQFVPQQNGRIRVVRGGAVLPAD